MCYNVSVMLGGRRFCAISLRPTIASHAHLRVPGVATGTTKAARICTTGHQTRVTNHVFLTPIIPALTVRSPVSPNVPALTQTPGVGGAVLFTGRWSPITGHELTPLFPLDTTIPPVSPLFPLDTKKQGGTPLPGITNRSNSGFYSAALPPPGLPSTFSRVPDLATGRKTAL